MSLLAAATVCCVLPAALILGLWLFYDRRDHARFERERRKTTFYCVRCGKIYARRGLRDEFPCPACGHKNQRLRF
ncbi:MAG: hydrogenase maturation nickel metallochaperone HypA [Opitutaceae bacterium]|nr:hydrogenase maturation nickel metallochaperone HypA [Opitutaceae bacterium]